MKKCILPKCVILLLIMAILFLYGRRIFFKSHILSEQESQNARIIQIDSFFHKISDHPVMYTIPDLKLYIYTSFIDQRFNQNVLRIFGLEEKDGVGVDFKCSWQDSGSEVTEESTARRYWIDKSWPDWSPYFACEYSCVIPSKSLPTQVTLVSTDQKYKLKVLIETVNRYVSHQPTTMALCVKPHSGYQGTARLVEWLETLKDVGYTNVIVYNSDMTGPGRHVLQYYNEIGFVTVVDFPFLIAMIQNIESPSLTAEQRYAIYQQIYLVAMHDCLYRFSALYKYIAFHDLDEIIVPTKSESILSMLKGAEASNQLAGGFLFHTIWHWEEYGPVNASEPLYMQKYLKATQANPQQPRSIVSTQRVITLNFQEILDVPKKEYKSTTLLPSDYGAVHSYKGTCASKFKKDVCEKMLTENLSPATVMTRYKKKVDYRVKYVRDHLKML